MKKLSWITNVLACLMIVLAALGAVCGAVVSKAHSPLLYGSESRAAVMDAMGFSSQEEVTAYIGLDWQQQDDLAGMLAGQMRLEHAEFDIDLLNEREQQHMRDVRDLVLLAQKVSQACMTIAAALAVVIAWTGARDQRRGLPAGVLIGALLVATVIVGAYALMQAHGFETLFVGMHEMLFTNDLWLLDPHTDILIRMMPQLLFERAAMDAAVKALQTFMIVYILLLAIHWIVGNMIRRNLTKREKQ